MTIHGSRVESNKSLSGLQRHLLFLSVETFPVRLEVLRRVGSWNSWSLSDNFATPSAVGKRNCSLLRGVKKTSFALILRGWISDASSFSNSSMSATRISLFKISEEYPG